jgi:NAD(P) transhydrogenase
MAQYDLICLGCGPAGEKAATQAAYFKRRVAIVEHCSMPGGAMVNTGTVPSKALRETALLCSSFRRRPLPGLDFSIKQGLSIPCFMAQRLLVEQQEHDRIEASMDRHEIDVIHGHGRIVDNHTVRVQHDDGTSSDLTAEFILIATGSSPARPKHIPFDDRTIVDADSVLELQKMPRSMTIVGAGVIGCEYACMFAEVGVQVTLINPRPSILPFLDDECRDQLVKAMTEAGIDMRLGDSVEAVAPAASAGAQVRFKDGTELTCDVLLWAAGRDGNTRDIGLESVGITTNDRGLIDVDPTYRTSSPSIYAAGDVIGFPALAATSMEQGRIAACHMFGLEFKTKLTDCLPIGLYTIPAVSCVGVTEEQAKGMEIVIGRARYHDNVRGRMLGDDTGLLKCIFDRKTRALLGATIIGEQATELIHIAQAAMAADLGIDYFIQACFNYPSLAELFKYAAYSALQSLATLAQQSGAATARAAA